MKTEDKQIVTITADAESQATLRDMAKKFEKSNIDLLHIAKKIAVHAKGQATGVSLNLLHAAILAAYKEELASLAKANRNAADSVKAGILANLLGGVMVVTKRSLTDGSVESEQTAASLSLAQAKALSATLSEMALPLDAQKRKQEEREITSQTSKVEKANQAFAFCLENSALFWNYVIAQNGVDRFVGVVRETGYTLTKNKTKPK